MSRHRILYEDSPTAISWDATRPTAPPPRTATPPSPARSPSAFTVSPLSTRGPALSSVRRKPVRERRPGQPIAEYYEDPEREAIELREAAAAGVPFLNIDEVSYMEPASRTSGHPGGERPGQPSREWGALKEEGVGRTDTGGTEAEDEESKLGINWRPRYLTRRIVASFVVLFVVMVIIIEVLAGVDRESDGLGYSNRGVSVLWTYGPPAILTLIAAFWNRVEFQARRFLPWIHLAREKNGPHDASETLLLDYTSIGMLKTLFLSAKRKHFLVMASIITRILLIMQVVLSTGFFAIQESRIEIDGVSTVLRRFILHSQLRFEDNQPAAVTVTAVEERRLRVSPGVAHTMTLLFVISALLTGWMVFLVPTQGVTPRNPNSLASTAVLLSNSPGISGRLQHVDHGNAGAVAERFEGLFYTRVERYTTDPPDTARFIIRCVADRRPSSHTRRKVNQADTSVVGDTYSPLVLRPGARIVTMVLTIGLAAILWGTLSHSNKYHGLADVGHTQAQAAAWTIFPAAVFMALTLYFWALDSETRFTAPFVDIFTSSNVSRGMTTIYTDELAPVTLYKAARRKSWSVLVTTTALLLVSFAPILAAGLFSPESIQQEMAVQIPPRAVVSGGVDVEPINEASLAANLILNNNNVSYLVWTYEDVVLPRSELTGGLSEEDSIQRRLLAVRVELTCKRLKHNFGELPDVECELLQPGRDEFLHTNDGTPSITSAIAKQHAVIRAQILSASPFRTALTDEGQQQQSGPAGVISTSFSCVRLVQKPVPTYILGTLLTAMFLLSVAGLWREPKGVAVPARCCPGSIAGVAGMLGSWGVFERIPMGGEWMGEEELERLFSDG